METTPVCVYVCAVFRACMCAAPVIGMFLIKQGVTLMGVKGGDNGGASSGMNRRRRGFQGLIGRPVA